MLLLRGYGARSPPLEDHTSLAQTSLLSSLFNVVVAAVRLARSFFLLELHAPCPRSTRPHVSECLPLAHSTEMQEEFVGSGHGGSRLWEAGPGCEC